MAAARQKTINAIGRRKTASARITLVPATGDEGKIVINNRTFENYFPLKVTQMDVMQPLTLTERDGRYNLKVTVVGGGQSGQAGAVRHAIARVLEKVEPELRPILKKAGLMTRDPRAVERKKPGRHKARKRPQFSKR